MSNQEALVLAYLDSVAKKDMDRCASMVDPDVVFTGPARTYTGVKELLAAFRMIGAIHVRNDIKRVFSDGNEVCVIYDFVTDTAGVVPTIEWVRLEGGRIKSINLYYDQVPWIKLREELQRRATAA